MGYNSIPYLYVKLRESMPAYQINSNGQLFKFEKGEYQNPSDEVMVSTSEIRQLVCAPIDRIVLWRRCDELFKRRKAERRNTFVTSSEEFGLGLLLEEVWRTLHQ
jgi:hypothetical protein